MLDVQTMFLKMNRGVRFDDAFLHKHQMDAFLRVPMSVETFQLPETFIKSLNAMIDEFAGVGQESNRSNNTAFLKELKKQN